MIESMIQSINALDLHNAEDRVTLAQLNRETTSCGVYIIFKKIFKNKKPSGFPKGFKRTNTFVYLKLLHGDYYQRRISCFTK